MVILSVIFSPCSSPSSLALKAPNREEKGLVKQGFLHVEERLSNFSRKNAVESGPNEDICSCEVRGGAVSGAKWRRVKLRVKVGERNIRI